MKDQFIIFLDTLLHFGLEKLGRFYGVYRGTVMSNEDPMNLGRLKVQCAAMYGNQTPEVWVMPRGNAAGQKYGMFWIPSEGDPIYVSTENGDPRFPLWEYGWWTKGNTPAGAKPKVYVFLTPQGQRVELNDEDNSIDVTNKDGFHVKLTSSGIYLGKGSENLGKFLTDLFTLLQATTVPTIYGASPFNNLADYTELNTHIAQFLKNSL